MKHRRFTLGLAVLALASATSGQAITEKEAEKSFKKATGSRAKEFGAQAKQAGKDFKTNFTADLLDPAKLAPQTFSDNTQVPFGANPFNDLMTHWNTFLTDLLGGAAGFESSINAATADAVTLLDDFSEPPAEAPTDLEGHYPVGFYPGDNAAFDRMADKMMKTLAKQMKSADKLLKKLQSTLAKSKIAPVGLTYQIALPLDPFVSAPAQDPIADANLPSNSRPLTISLVVGVSILDNDPSIADGVICVSGSCDGDVNEDDVSDNLDSVVVSIIAEDGTVALSGTPNPTAAGRWKFCSINAGGNPLLPAGNYLVEAYQGDSTFRQVSRTLIGIR